MNRVVQLARLAASAPRSRAEWATRINEAWQRSLAGVLDAGRALIEAKAALDHGEFMAMIDNELPFGVNMVGRLMKIARNPELVNSDHSQILPTSWQTLYELTKLDDATLAAALADGRIRPDMERSEAQLLRTAERRTERLRRNEAWARRTVPLAERVQARRTYPVIYADPPWQHKTWSEAGKNKSPENHYPTMSLDALKAEPIVDLAAPRAALFLWTTVPHLAEAMELMSAWGFAYRSHVVWIKTNADGTVKRGTGKWFANAHELLLLGGRGDIPMPLPGTQMLSAIEAPAGRHSEKPTLFREMIERYFPGVGRIELYCRGPAAPGWEAWGHEANAVLSPALPEKTCARRIGACSVRP
jgi:N6-adenosine-specific RNA methylase IME4